MTFYGQRIGSTMFPNWLLFHLSWSAFSFNFLWAGSLIFPTLSQGTIRDPAPPVCSPPPHKLWLTITLPEFCFLRLKESSFIYNIYFWQISLFNFKICCFAMPVCSPPPHKLRLTKTLGFLLHSNKHNNLLPCNKHLFNSLTYVIPHCQLPLNMLRLYLSRKRRHFNISTNSYSCNLTIVNFNGNL